jgi:hypothetical protein
MTPRPNPDTGGEIVKLKRSHVLKFEPHPLLYQTPTVLPFFLCPQASHSNLCPERFSMAGSNGLTWLRDIIPGLFSYGSLPIVYCNSENARSTLRFHH